MGKMREVVLEVELETALVATSEGVQAPIRVKQAPLVLKCSSWPFVCEERPGTSTKASSTDAETAG